MARMSAISWNEKTENPKKHRVRNEDIRRDCGSYLWPFGQCWRRIQALWSTFLQRERLRARDELKWLRVLERVLGVLNSKHFLVKQVVDQLGR